MEVDESENLLAAPVAKPAPMDASQLPPMKQCLQVCQEP